VLYRPHSQNHTWCNKVIGLALQTRNPYTYGNAEVGDRHGVQGWFHKYFGEVLNSISVTIDENTLLSFHHRSCLPIALNIVGSSALNIAIHDVDTADTKRLR
jgi:hypothetical protein